MQKFLIGLFLASGIAAGAGYIKNSDISSTAAIAWSKMAAQTASKVACTNGSGVLSTCSTSSANVAFLDATSSIQTQLDAKQSLDADLTALGGVTSAADKVPYFTGSATAAVATFTSAARTFLAAVDAAAETAILNVFTGDSGSGGVKGMVPAPSSGDAAAGKFLKASGGWAVPSPAVADVSVLTKTADYTLSSSDNVILANPSGTFTLTLPTAVGITGHVYYLVKIANDNTNTVTIATTSAQTIGGKSNVHLFTYNESWVLVSDGSNWQVLSHKAAVPWTSFSMTITSATSGSPTRGTVASEKAVWRRVNDTMEIAFDYRQTASTGSAAGSGTYLFAVPSPCSVSTSNLGTLPSGTSGYVKVGDANVSINSDGIGGTTSSPGHVFLYDSSHLFITFLPSDGTNYQPPETAVSSTQRTLTNTNVIYSFRARVPCSWEE